MCIHVSGGKNKEKKEKKLWKHVYVCPGGAKEGKKTNMKETTPETCICIDMLAVV